MQAITDFSTQARRRRYSSAERESLVQQVRQMRAHGMKMSAIALELGVSAITLTKWVKSSLQVPGFLPVQLVPPSVPSSVGLTLVTPAGFRLEGLTTETALALLRQLG